MFFNLCVPVGFYTNKTVHSFIQSSVCLRRASETFRRLCSPFEYPSCSRTASKRLLPSTDFRCEFYTSASDSVIPDAVVGLCSDPPAPSVRVERGPSCQSGCSRVCRRQSKTEAVAFPDSLRCVFLISGLNLGRDCLYISDIDLLWCCDPKTIIAPLARTLISRLIYRPGDHSWPY